MSDEIKKLITKFGAMVYFVPPKILGRKNAITYKSLDGYIILIREGLSPEKITDTAEHELWHIILGHLDSKKDLSEREKEKEVLKNIGGTK